MTTTELNELLESLNKEKALVKRELDEVTVRRPEGLEPKRNDYGEADDPDSYAHEMTDLDRNMAMEQELRNRLNNIEKTIDKIQAGQYGKCENCAQDIQVERLRAIPAAMLCVDCARKQAS